MFLLHKISCHIKEHKFSYLLLLCIIFVGFLSGCFYCNLISDTELRDAGMQAEEFIKIAKENELDFRLMLCEELSSYLLIALFSLFLPGFLFTIFLVFKWGFSTGFFLTFLVKYFAVKGFFLSGLFLFLQLVFLLPALLATANQSLSVNRFLIASSLRGAPAKNSLISELLVMAIITLAVILFVMLAVGLKLTILPPFCNYLFL
ncbi:MAG: hypothetical protein IKW04_06315 [Clostridia bacterium]|nr:hypothetical protein [Clostridia bacterium]